MLCPFALMFWGLAFFSSLLCFVFVFRLVFFSLFLFVFRIVFFLFLLVFFYSVVRFEVFVHQQHKVKFSVRVFLFISWESSILFVYVTYLLTNWSQILKNSPQKSNWNWFILEIHLFIVKSKNMSTKFPRFDFCIH